MLTEAGLAGGMRVLDIGSGAGDVAMAAVVGSAGRVVGVVVNAEILGRRLGPESRKPVKTMSSSWPGTRGPWT